MGTKTVICVMDGRKNCIITTIIIIIHDALLDELFREERALE